MSRARARSERRPDGAYFTPDPVARGLVNLLPLRPGDPCLEPSAGGGAFSRALAARGCAVESVDLVPLREPDPLPLFALPPRPGTPRIDPGDFLSPTWRPRTPPLWIVGNPDFSVAEDFLEKSLSITGRFVAFLLRLAFLESQRRYLQWQRWPLLHVYVLAERLDFTGDGGDLAAYGFFLFDRRKPNAQKATLDVVSLEER